MENLDRYIIELVLTIILALITAFVIPWLKEKIGDAKFEQILKWVETAVKAAEQLYKGSGRGAVKKSFVVDFLNEKGIDIDQDSLDKLIESAVLDLNKNK